MQQRTQNNDLRKFPTERKKGVIATIIFHVVLGGVLILAGFHTPLPLPEEEGILVNFGTGETGFGLIEPVAASSAEEASSLPESGETDTQTQNSENISPAESTLTQDFEEAPVVKKTIEQPDPEEVKRKQKEAEAEKVRLQKLEEERIQREAEEAERIRKTEEEARLKKEAEEREQRRIDIINRTRNALNNAGSTGTNTDTSEGIAGGEGNQGAETGSVDSNIYGQGTGTGTKGVSFDLAGRQARGTLPKPSYDINEEGIVVVEVTVDSNGNVTNAIPGVKGSTILKEYFLKVARKAAMDAKFNRKPDTPFQKGTITYHFILE